MIPAPVPSAVRPVRAPAVTVIGVLFLSLAGMWLLGILFQGAFFAFLGAMRPGGVTLGDVSADANVPVSIRFMIQYAKFFWILNIAAALGVALGSIGLLRRRNWARIAFVLLAVLGLIYSLVSVAASLLMIPYMRAQMGNLAALDVGPLFSTVATVAFSILVVKSLFLAGFFFWMLRKLTRPAIRAEFS